MANYFAKNLKFLRESKKIEQQRLADDLNIPRSTLSCWENGLRTPKIEQILDITKYFNVNIDIISRDYSNDNEEKQETTEQDDMELLKTTLQRKGFLNENEEMTKEDFDKLMDFAKANKQFIMKDTEERK